VCPNGSINVSCAMLLPNIGLQLVKVTMPSREWMTAREVRSVGSISGGGTRNHRVPAMDVAEWLRKLELEQYAPAFRENEIDGRVLPNLTAEDLKDVGVSLVGHRRRLLEAIAALRTGAPPASETSVLAAAAIRRGWRRQSRASAASSRSMSATAC
jgi:SAM domain (Sterile alpha motif)